MCRAPSKHSTNASSHHQHHFNQYHLFPPSWKQCPDMTADPISCVSGPRLSRSLSTDACGHTLECTVQRKRQRNQDLRCKLWGQEEVTMTPMNTVCKFLHFSSLLTFSPSPIQSSEPPQSTLTPTTSLHPQFKAAIILCLDRCTSPLTVPPTPTLTCTPNLFYMLHVQ